MDLDLATGMFLSSYMFKFGGDVYYLTISTFYYFNSINLDEFILLKSQSY